MTYQETIDFLYSRLPMFSRIGAAAFKPSLDNTLRLCKNLDDPQKKFKSVHIAGTNGKGSVSHMLAAILQTAGYRTGLYTSPHLKDFRERIRINGEMVTEDFVVDFTRRVTPMIDEVEPSFFEITVAMAFDYFASNDVEIAVIETGLGGRLDSTNVIVPELSVITNIGWDHMNLLGDTLEKIAGEKAGIIKPGVPVIIGEVLPETRPVFESVAASNKSPIVIAGEKRSVMDWQWKHHELVVEVAAAHQTDHQVYRLGLTGIYQGKNLLTVLEVCSQLVEKGFKIDYAAILEGLRFTRVYTGFHGRWEQIQEHPSVILDVAHNEDGMRQVGEQLELTDHHELHIILGMVKDKEVDHVLKLLPATARYYFTQAQIPRALDAASLEEKAARHGLRGHTYPNVNAALSAAKNSASKNDLVLVCGSVFLVAEVNY